MCVALALLAAWSTINVAISSDATAHVQTAHSYLVEGNADIDEYASLGPPLEAFRTRIGGHWYAPYTSGNALLIAIPAALVAPLGIDPTSVAGVGPFPKVVATCFVAASVGLVYLTARRLVEGRIALYVTFAYAFGSNAFAAGQSYTEHPASLFLGAAAMLLALRGGTRDIALAGLAVGTAVIVRPANAFLGAALLAFVAQDGRRAAIRYALWTLPAAAFQMTIGTVAFGTPFFTGGPLPLGSVAEGMGGLLISPSRGLLVYSPWLVLPLAALAAAWRGPVDRERRLLRYGSLATVGVWVLFGSYAQWWGGFTFGNRYLSDLSPLYAVALADAFRRGWLRGAAARASLAAAIAWSVLLQAVGAGLYPFTWDGRHWDLTPHIDATPWRLWDWGDTQWQFVLRRYVTDPGPAMILESAAVLACVVAFAILALAARRRDDPASATAARG